MKIGFNAKKLTKSIISYIEELMTEIYNIIQIHETRIQHIENSDWLKLISGIDNIEINQEFSEIRMIAKVFDTENITYSFSCNYDSNIFHNSTTRNAEYFITGNPTTNNYGCKFKYSVSQDGKQYISVDSCYNGNNTVDCVLDVWIKTVPTGTQ